eukprot:328682_1
MGQFLGVHKLKAYVKRNVKKKLQKNIPPPHESQPLIVDEPNDQISYEHNGSDHIYEFTDDEEQKENETDGFQIQCIPNASTPMDTIYTHDDVTPFVNVMPIATKMPISENEMMCGALGRISNKPMDLTEVFTTDDELQNDSDSDVIGMAYDVGGTVYCHGDNDHNPSANPPDSDRGDGDDDEIVEEYGNRKINWDTTKSSSNPTARVFEHEFRHRYAFGTAIIDTDDLEGDETKGAINDTKQISECMTPITRKDVVQCNEQTIHEGCVNCDGIHGIDCIAKALISRNKKQDGEPGTDANTDSVPTVLPLDLTPQPETHIFDTEMICNKGYLDDDELSEDLDSDGMGGGEIIRYEEPHACKHAVHTCLMHPQFNGNNPSAHQQEPTQNHSNDPGKDDLYDEPMENVTKVEFIGESIPDASNPIQQDEWSADTMYPFVYAMFEAALLLCLCECGKNDTLCNVHTEDGMSALNLEGDETQDDVNDATQIPEYTTPITSADLMQYSLLSTPWVEPKPKTDDLFGILKKYTAFIHDPHLHCMDMDYIDSIDTNKMCNDYLNILDQSGAHVFRQCDNHPCEIYKMHNTRFSESTSSKNSYHLECIAETLSSEEEHRIEYFFDLLNKIHVALYHQSQVGNKSQCKNGMNARNRTKFMSLCIINRKLETSKTKEMFCYGTPIQYGYKNEIVRSDAIKVQPRFGSLMEEITSNNICCLTMEQFRREFKKAQMQFATEIRKTHYPLLSLQHILALMIWCNYNTLQYKFSETFREFESMNHVDFEFYHFGMYLKSAVHEHGTRIMDGHIDKFYRGLDKSLVFSETAIQINGPFSTTSRRDVAVNFANGGMVIEMCDQLGFNKYFSVGWLSAYSFESEYLFMDNEYPLTVSNITSAVTGSQYTFVLTALSLCKKLITHQPIATQDMCIYSDSHTMGKIWKYIFSSKTPPTYFDQYSEYLIESFCENQTQIIIDHDWKRTYPFMFHLSFKSVDGCTTLNIDALCDVFPNIECITALHAPLSTLLVHDIYTTLKTHPLEYVQLQSMRTTTQMALAHYPALFKQINYSIDVHDNRLCFYRADCDVPPPCRMDQPCYKDEVYNQCSQYLDSNPHASEFVRSVYEHRKGHQMNFADDTVQVKTLISHFLAYQEHLNRLRASLQSYCGDDHPLMPLLCRDIMQTITPNYYLEDKIETPTLKSAITLSECMIEPIVIPADTHMQTLAAAAKTIISENEMICNANTEDEMFAYLKEAIELKRNRDLSDMISNAKYSTDTEDVYTDHELETDCNDSQFDSISLDESYVPGLVSCTPCAFSEEPHKHGVVTCPGTNDNNTSNSPSKSTADDSKQNPPDDLPEESTNNENNDNQQNAKKRGDGGDDDGDKKKNTGDGVPGDNDEEEEEEEDDEDEEDEDKEDEKNEIAKEQQNPKMDC